MNPDMCAVNVQNRVSQAQALLPAEVTRIGVTVTKRQTSQVLMFTLTSDGRYDDEFLTNYNNINIIPAIKRIQGVGDVQSPLLHAYLAETRCDETVQPDAFGHQWCAG